MDQPHITTPCSNSHWWALWPIPARKAPTPACACEWYLVRIDAHYPHLRLFPWILVLQPDLEGPPILCSKQPCLSPLAYLLVQWPCPWKFLGSHSSFRHEPSGFYLSPSVPSLDHIQAHTFKSPELAALKPPRFHTAPLVLWLLDPRSYQLQPAGWESCVTSLSHPKISWPQLSSQQGENPGSQTFPFSYPLQTALSSFPQSG